jgi:hypothetical protein
MGYAAPTIKVPVSASSINTIAGSLLLSGDYTSLRFLFAFAQHFGDL